MKKYIVVFLLILISIPLYFFYQQQKTTPVNEKIMYGYSDYEDYLKNSPEEYKKYDEEFVNNIKKWIESGESKVDGVSNLQDAAQWACNKGFDYFNSGDELTAIKRFNQAWLLDHKHSCVYAAYGYYYAFIKNDFDNSFGMYENAISVSSEKDSWWIMLDYGEALLSCYSNNNERLDCLENAKINIEKSSKIMNTPKTHRALALLYYELGEYDKSWNEVHLAIDGGVPKGVLVGLIDELKTKAKDPKGEF